MEDVQDEAVWQRVLGGAAEQFGVVWDRHHHRVFRHLVKGGIAPSEAEDLTATVFLELWRRRHAVRFVEGSALPWLIVTAQNVLRNSRRARRRYRTFLAKLPPPEHAPDPARQVAERNGALTTHVRRELARADETDRYLFVLTALEHFTIPEAAAATGISVPAAKMRLSRLRTRLKATLPDT